MVTINWILFGINLVFFGVCFFFILNRKRYSCLSIRSPGLLIANNFCSFIMSTIVILNEILNKKKENESIDSKEKWMIIINSFFLLFQVILIISFILRCHRIVVCCEINSDEREDREKFYRKRYLFQQPFYMKILMIVSSVILIIFVIVDLILYYYKSCTLLLPFFIKDKQNEDCSNLNSMVWMVLSFCELIILITYAYFMTVNEVKQKIRLEIYLFTLTWAIYSNIILFKTIGGETYGPYITLLTLYICTFLNGFIPCILSYFYHTSIGYYFNPKLMSNLYLFLSNEDCYGAFAKYIEEREDGVFYLKLYTHIMEYKLSMFCEESQVDVNQERQNIINNYFTNNQKAAELLGEEIIESVQNGNHSSDIKKEDIFDEALKKCYTKLGEFFENFKREKEYQTLADHLAVTSYIQCKMCNTGLINKF